MTQTDHQWASAPVAQDVDQRLVKPLSPLLVGDWRLKVYGIALEGHEVGADLESAGRDIASEHLPTPATGEGRHGAGFLVVHDGAVGRWALVFWWSHGILLCERLFHSKVGEPIELRPAEGSVIACVYELQVVEWERRSWVRCLGEQRADTDAYLADTMPEQPAIGWATA